MLRPFLSPAASACALVLLAACSGPLPPLPLASPTASVPASAAAPASVPAAAPARVQAPKPPSALAEFEGNVAGLAVLSGVNVEPLDEGALLLRAAGDGAFSPASTALTPRFGGFLKQLATRLVQVPRLNVHITGHTDATGNAQRNDKISDGRAQAAARVLVQNGVADFRVAASGKGQREPIAGNDTAAGRARNRRVDIVITEGR